MFLCRELEYRHVPNTSSTPPDGVKILQWRKMVLASMERRLLALASPTNSLIKWAEPRDFLLFLLDHWAPRSRTQVSAPPSKPVSDYVRVDIEDEENEDEDEEFSSPKR
jgi:hypothetical protein